MAQQDVCFFFFPSWRIIRIWKAERSALRISPTSTKTHSPNHQPFPWGSLLHHKLPGPWLEEALCHPQKPLWTRHRLNTQACSSREMWPRDGCCFHEEMSISFPVLSQGSLFYATPVLFIAGQLCVWGKGESFLEAVYLNCKTIRGKETRGKAIADLLRRAQERLYNGHLGHLKQLLSLNMQPQIPFR